MFDALPTFDADEPDTLSMIREIPVHEESIPDLDGPRKLSTGEQAWYDVAYATRTAKEARELEQIASNLINSKGIIYGCDLAALMYEIEGR